jgi:hypothetical protein
MLEHSALALNPNSRLFGATTLHGHVVADRNTEALTAFRRAQAAGTWSVHRVQRIIWAGGDENTKGPAWRSVHTVGVADTRAAAVERLRQLAATRGGEVEVDEYRIPRSWVLHRGFSYPVREWFDVVRRWPGTRYGQASPGRGGRWAWGRSSWR